MIDLLLGFFTPWLIYAGILALHFLLPARSVEGYVRDERSGELLRYRLNGPLVLVVSLGAWLGAGYSGIMPWDWLWTHRWSGAAGAFALGLLVSAAVVLSAPSRGGSLLREFYLGRRTNPQWLNGRVDSKMYLYLAGATLLELNLLAFAAHHFLTYPDDPSPGIVLYVALFSWFVCDYVVFERVHRLWFGAGTGLAADDRSLAVPPLLRGAAVPAGARRRSPLRRKVWTPMGTIP